MQGQFLHHCVVIIYQFGGILVNLEIDIFVNVFAGASREMAVGGVHGSNNGILCLQEKNKTLILVSACFWI